MTAYGKVWQTWKRFVCSPTFVRVNGTFEKDEHILQWRMVPPPIATIEDGTLTIDFDVKVCNATEADPLCWSYSTGDFEDSEGILHHRWTGPAPDPNRKMFEPGPAHIITWGWLYY